MFASRLPPQICATALTRLIAGERAKGVEILDLTGSNPTRAGIEYPREAILRGFQDARVLTYDPDSLGLPEARERIAELERVDASRIVLTASSSEGYSWLFKLLCNPGDEILTPRPSYPLFEMLANLESVAVRQYPLRHHEGWFVDVPQLMQAVTPKTRAIVVVNPNNPTGNFLKEAEYEAIVSLGLPLICDEVFRDYALATKAPRVRDERVLTFTLNGLSKLVGMPQMKLGWIAVTGPEELCEEAMARLEIIADTYLSVGTPVQYALGALLSARDSVGGQIVERCRANLQVLRHAMQGTPFTPLDAEGGWSAVLRVPRVRSDEEWVSLLLRRHAVLVQPGYFYDFDKGGFLVLSLLTPPEVFREGVRRIAAIG